MHYDVWILAKLYRMNDDEVTWASAKATKHLSPDKHSVARGSLGGLGPFYTEQVKAWILNKVAHVWNLNSDEFWEELNYHQIGTYSISSKMIILGKYLSNLKINTEYKIWRAVHTN